MKKICLICKKEYKGRNKYTCSRACYALHKTHTKKCVVCGKEFNAPQSNMTITCSHECSTINRKKLHADGVYIGSLEKAHEAFPAHPLTGRFETNINARTWVIQAPSGEIYECRNLALWLREHAEMLDGTVTQAWDGITKIKYSMQGKRKNKNSQWKGWRLIRWWED